MIVLTRCLHDVGGRQDKIVCFEVRLKASMQDLTTTISQITLVEQAPSNHNIRLFYTLRRSHLKLDANGYWNRLTLESYKIYRAIYRRCRDETDRKVRFQKFIREFDDSLGPPPAIIVEFWNKIIPKADRKPGKKLPPLSQGQLLSVLYMLHIFYTLQKSPPSEITDWQRGRLNRFADWTPCHCGLDCGRAWNFTSRPGIWRQNSSSSSSSLTLDLGNNSNGPCLVDMYLNYNFRDAEHVSAYDETEKSWWNAYTNSRNRSAA